MRNFTGAKPNGKQWRSEMLLFVAALFLVAAGSVTIPSVSLLCLVAGIGSILLEAFLP